MNFYGKRFLSVFLLLIFYSCSKHDVIYYTYNGVTITRFDSDADSYFYYGNYEKDCPPKIKDYVHIQYNGFNNGLDCFLVFRPDKSVEFIRYGGLGSAEQIGANPLLIVDRDYDNGLFDSIIKKYRSDYGFIRISDSKIQEKQWADENQYNVNTLYR